MKPKDDLSASPDAPVLSYGTHDRAGPWWQRWLRAWGRAAKPALIAAAIVAALAYSVAPREYTAVATVDVEPDVITAARGSGTSPEQDAARADALARSLKNTRYLQQVLNSAQWRTARLLHPGTTVFEPISAEAVPKTKTVRIRFTDPSPEAARIGAEATVAALKPMDDRVDEDPAAVLQRQLVPLMEAERLTKLKAGEARVLQAATATRPATQPANAALRRRPRTPEAPGLTAQQQFLFASQRRAAVEQQLAGTPRVRRGPPVTMPRFASNQRELSVSALVAAGVVFPLVFVVALFHGWRYSRAATTNVEADRIFSVADLASVLMPARVGSMRLLARRALGPACMAAAIAGAVACCFAPRRYTATATIVAAAPLPAAGSPAGSTGPTATPADAIAALAAAAARPDVLQQVVGSPQWQIARGGTGGSPAGASQTGPRIDVSSDATSVVVRFTDADPDAARFGAEAAMNAARAAVIRGRADAARIRLQFLRAQSTQARLRGTNISTSGAVGQRLLAEADAAAAAAEIAGAVRIAVAQLPAATTSGSSLPSNFGEMLKAAAVPAAYAFGVAFVAAMVWFRRSDVRLALGRTADDARVAAVASAAQPAIQLAAVAAVVVGIVGYAVTPRTYTATATLRVRTATTPAVRAFPSALPIVTSRVAAEAGYIVPGVQVGTELQAGTIAISYTDRHPDIAANGANAIASSLAATWRKSVDDRDRRMLFDRGGNWRLSGMAGTRDPGTPRELTEWSMVSKGAQVEVTNRATSPRWADQGDPLTTAALTALAAFIAVLFAIELLRTARQRSMRAQSPVVAASL